MTVVEQIKSPVPQYLENLLDEVRGNTDGAVACLLYTSPSPRDS